MQKHEDEKSPKRANIARINFVAVRPLLALASDKVEREDGLSKLHLPPQVPVASLPSPAVMDIRPLLALASDKVEREDGLLS